MIYWPDSWPIIVHSRTSCSENGVQDSAMLLQLGAGDEEFDFLHFVCSILFTARCVRQCALLITRLFSGLYVSGISILLYLILAKAKVLKLS